MPLSIKIKILLVWSLTTLGIFMSPATAEAPHLEEIRAEKVAIIKELQIKDKAYEDPKAYALTLFDKYGWKDNQMTCLDQLWTKESNWRHKADNPNSTAYGIAQILGEKKTHPADQIANGLRYIEHRYGTPCEAWKFWRSHYWY
jgi:hypothetical protein